MRLLDILINCPENQINPSLLSERAVDCGALTGKVQPCQSFDFAELGGELVCAGIADKDLWCISGEDTMSGMEAGVIARGGG